MVLENWCVLEDIPKDTEWLKVFYKGLEFNYRVSSYGHIMNPRGKLLRGFVHGSRQGSYPTVKLNRNGIQFTIDRHRLVATMFCKNESPAIYTVVDHLDGNRLNPYYKNLEWVTPQENQRRKWARLAKLSENQKLKVLGICKYSDYCNGICAGCKMYEEAK